MRTATINIFNSDGGHLNSWTVPMELFSDTMALIARNEVSDMVDKELADKEPGYDVISFGLRIGFEFHK